jgi:hypothetical protein
MSEPAKTPRIDMDRLITWIMMALVAGAFGWLVTEVKAVGAKLDSINTRVVVLEAQQLSLRLDRQEERLRIVEGKVK